MGIIRPRQNVLLLTAAFSRHGEVFQWLREQSEKAWGPIALESPMFDFANTEYYERTMGPGLKKQFWAFEKLAPPNCLPEVKIQSNAWEEELAASGRYPDERPLNMDPGYMTLGKLVLASTKDHAHRIYLDRDIFAEVTLYYRDGDWRSNPWTFADYRAFDYYDFFDECRNYLRKQLA